MDKLRYKIKRNWLDYALAFLAVNLFLFCCDMPVLKGFDIYDHTGKDFLYDISMALLTTIFIYFLQKIYTHFMQIKKFDRIICTQCLGVVECIKEMVWLITGDHDYLNMSKEVLLDKLNRIDIDEIGSKYYVDNKELVLRDAILRLDRQMLQRIDVVLGMPFVDADLLDVIYELRTLGMHKTWDEILLSANGHIYTIAEEKGKSYGGLHLQFNREREIADGIEQCITKIKKMRTVLEVVYGYSF